MVPTVLRATRLPFFGELAGAPEDEYAERAAQSIEHDIVEGGAATRYEALVDFIGAGVEEDHHDGPPCLAPVPWAAVLAGVLPFCAPEKDGAQAVFRQVRAFAGDQNTGPHAILRHSGEQPVHERFHNAR